MKTKLIFLFFLTAAFTLISCSEDVNSTDNEESGRLTISLTDAPFPYDLVAEANVTIFKIEARLKSKDDSEDESSQENTVDENEMDKDSPFITLMEEEIDVNLLNLTNGVTEQMASLEVPIGTYDLIRVYVKNTNVVLTDGRSFELKVPSGEQTGIKIFIKPGLQVTSQLSSDLLLDFDVSRSFIAQGNTKKVDGINGFIFKPVIKVSNLSTAGTLAGNISNLIDEMPAPLEGAQISVMAGDTINTTAFSAVDGNYMVMGLEAGSYKVFTELEGYVPSDTVEVQINAANKTIQDFLLEVVSSEETEGGN